MIQELLPACFKFYTDPMKLNIVGIRKQLHTNAFDDELRVGYHDAAGKYHETAWAITTDPGSSSLIKGKSKGTAILVPGQYEDTYAIDLHRGSYQALCQRLGKVRVYRDKNKDSKHDLVDCGIEEGFFGINIHKAGRHSKLVDGWSAGCQVFQKEDDFKHFMSLCKVHAKLYGNCFTYTLI